LLEPLLNDCPQKCVDIKYPKNEEKPYRCECEKEYIDTDTTKPGRNCNLKNNEHVVVLNILNHIHFAHQIQLSNVIVQKDIH